MKAFVRKVAVCAFSLLLLVCCAAPASAVTVTSTQLLNAAIAIITENEGSYTTIVKNDNGAVSIGKLQWHASRALDLLRRIIAANQTQALNILGATFYNEILTSSGWGYRVFDSEEASVTARLLATNESIRIQNELAESEVGGYINHGVSLGITDPDALVFFADYENQTGSGGASSFVSNVKSSTGHANPSLYDLYSCSSQNSRRTRVYNFCRSLNWTQYNQAPATPVTADNVPPVISGILVKNVTDVGYSVSFNAGDNTALSSVYVITYYTRDGENGQKWQSLSTAYADYTAKISIADYGNRQGYYTTAIYAYDTSGNYSFATLLPVLVGEEPEDPVVPATFKVAVTPYAYTEKVGTDITWVCLVTPDSWDYRFVFVVTRDGEKIVEQETGDIPEYTLQNASAGTYVAEVLVFNKTTKEYATGTSSAVGLYEDITVTSVTADKKELRSDETVTFTANTRGGSKDKTYSWTIWRDGEVWDNPTPFSAESSFSFTPTQDGVYTAEVSVADAAGRSDSGKSAEVKVSSPLVLRSAALVNNYAVVGSTVRIRAEYAGGGDAPEASVMIEDREGNGKRIACSDEGDGEYAFIAPYAGEFTVTLSLYGEEEQQVSGQCGGSLTVDAAPKTGDADGNGEITAADARLALRISARLEVPLVGFESVCDVDGDDKITASDARKILRVSAKLDKFGVRPKEAESSSS